MKLLSTFRLCSPCRKMTLLPLTVLVLLIGCGSLGSSSSVSTASPDSAKSPFVRVRWFPISDAESYVLLVETTSGELLINQEIQAQGCTHAPQDGFTSGICFYDFKRDEQNSELAIQLGARTSSGVTEASLLRYRK